MSRKKAVVLVSGGLDSATVLAIAKIANFEVHALTFDYGQRHVMEVTAARKVCETIGVSSHTVMDFNMRAIGGSSLTSELQVPMDGGAGGGGIPNTYVPARNTVFLSFALALAETLESEDIYIGANAVDYSGYPDCRMEYLKAFERMANLATARGVDGLQKLSIRAPLVSLTKAEIISLGLKLGVDYSITSSCYSPSEAGACGRCDSCRIRRDGFSEAGVVDPTRYV